MLQDDEDITKASDQWQRLCQILEYLNVNFDIKPHLHLTFILTEHLTKKMQKNGNLQNL